MRAHRGFLHTLLSSFWWLAGLQTPPDSAFFTLLQGLLKSVLKQSHGAGTVLDMQGHCAELPELACVHQQSHCAHVQHAKRVGNRVIVHVPCQLLANAGSLCRICFVLNKNRVGFFDRDLFS